MSFAGISYVAVLAAAVASFMFGGAWYGILAKPWMAALGKTEAEIKASGSSATPMVIAFVSQLVMAWALAGVIGHLGSGQVTVGNGIISAFFVWLGFVVTTQVTNHAFQQQTRSLTLIDCGHWLGVLLIQGLVIGLIGV
ncbi:MAG: DUF1761 domain-containing protein [Hyphomicrobiaceae bacterium]